MTPLHIYRNVVALDRDAHRTLKLAPAQDHRFAQTMAAVPLAPIEISAACRDYPIVFARNQDGSLCILALTGTREGENLFIDAAGQWQADYVPAFIRRYPFVFAQTQPDQHTLCIDQDCPGFNTDTGDALFLPEGDTAPVLEQALALLADYQNQMQRGVDFLQQLDAAGLLVEQEFAVNVAAEQRARIDGMLLVDEQKLKQLPADIVAAWHTGGQLGLIYAHLLSLGNLSKLARRTLEPSTASPTSNTASTATPPSALH